MDLTLMLWLGGMFFSLAVFVVKVGCGLGWGQLRWPLIVLTLSLYSGLFILAAIFSRSLLKVLQPVLQHGPWLHSFMAVGMMAWGIYLLLRSPASSCCGLPGQKAGNSTPNHCSPPVNSALFLLLLPCPVCLTAIIFSTWAALQVFKWPSWLVGVGLGLTFAALTLVACLILRLSSRRATKLAQNNVLALSLLGIGAYFLASLFIPGRIEAARSIYHSFISDHTGPGLSDQLGILTILAIALLVGFVTKQNHKVLK